MKNKYHFSSIDYHLSACKIADIVFENHLKETDELDFQVWVDAYKEIVRTLVEEL